MIEKIREDPTNAFAPLKLLLWISGIIGTVWGILRIFDYVYANLGSEYRPSEELDNFLENLVKHIKTMIS